ARAASRHSHVSARTATAAERLVRDDSGAVRGVQVRGERRGASQALGGRVLIACGGFAGDDVLVAQHCPAAARLPYHGGTRATAARTADPFFARVVLPRTGRRGATLEDLAKQFELNAEGLGHTVESLNQGLLAPGGDPFGRRRFAGPLEPPFHAIRVTGARWRTFGGLALAASGRAIDAAR